MEITRVWSTQERKCEEVTRSIVNSRREVRKSYLGGGGGCETVTRGMAYTEKEIRGKDPLMMYSRADM